MRLDLKALWRFITSDEGRATRKDYWLFFLGCIGLTLVLLSLPVFGVRAVVPVAISLILIYPSYCVIAKRLQDVGVAGQWAIFMSLIAAIDAIWIAAGKGGQAHWLLSALRELWWWLALANMIAFFVLGLLPGQRGPNAYGPERL